MIDLGIFAYYHDIAAAIVRDGEIVAAVQEERFSRRKADSEFPGAAATYCLDEAGVTLDQVDYVGFYDKPLQIFDRLLETYLAFAPTGLTSFVRSIPIWVKQKLLLKKSLLDDLNALERGNLTAEQVLFGFHHHSHAASAFYPSPFEEAAILVMDGVGEWATTTLGRGTGTDIELLSEIRFPHSLGMLYSVVTYYLGFKVNDGEYKVMGLAPYGEPNYVDRIYDNLIDLKDDGSFRLDMRCFNYCTGLTMTNSRFDDLFDGLPPRKEGVPLTQRDMDIARSVQVVTEEIVLRLCRTLHAKTGHNNLCLTGGVALNCLANGRILREGPFENLWIQPAAGDAGGALGVALAIAHSHDEKRINLNGRQDAMNGSYLGSAYDTAAVHTALNNYGAVFHDLDDGAADSLPAGPWYDLDRGSRHRNHAVHLRHLLGTA